MNDTNEFSFMLKPSSISGAGVGVFALGDIAKGSKLALHTDNHVSREMKASEVPEELLTYCVAKDETTYLCPEHFNRMEVGWFVNHSEQPNVEKRPDGYHALTNIMAGDEIFMDYNKLHEPGDKKEAFYNNQTNSQN